jgi:hypothetical protein
MAGHKCTECGEENHLKCHDEWWSCSNIYELYKIKEVESLRTRLALAEQVVEAARGEAYGHNHYRECALCGSIRAYDEGSIGATMVQRKR